MEALKQSGYCVLTLLHQVHISQRAIQPAPELPATHGGCGPVHHPGQGVLVPAHEVDINFQVTATGGVENNRFVAAFPGQLTNVGQSGALGFFRVLQ